MLEEPQNYRGTLRYVVRSACGSKSNGNGYDNDHANSKAKHTAHLFHHSSMYQRTDKLHDSFVKCSSIWFYLLSDSVIFEAGSGPQTKFQN